VQLHTIANTCNVAYQANTLDVNPLHGRHRAAAVAHLSDIILAQLRVASACGKYNVNSNVVSVLICCDIQVASFLTAMSNLDEMHNQRINMHRGSRFVGTC
jgi:hypothetical protein